MGKQLDTLLLILLYGKGKLQQGDYLKSYLLILVVPLRSRLVSPARDFEKRHFPTLTRVVQRE